jgi:hypothetical protein
LHPRGRKKRIGFDLNSKPHSPRPFPLQHDEPPKLASAVRSEGRVERKRRLAAAMPVTLENKRWETGSRAKVI